MNIRNKKIMQHQEYMDNILTNIGIKKNKTILERTKSQNDLYMKSNRKKRNIFPKMQQILENIN